MDRREEIWCDGVQEEMVSVGDRGLSYGDGLFETVQVLKGHPVWMEAHQARLIKGCKRLRIPLNSAELKRLLQRFVQTSFLNKDGILKILVTRGSGLRGYCPRKTRTRFIFQAFPPAQYPNQYAEHGIPLFLCETRLAHQPRLAGMKHLNRLEQVLARMEWSEGYPEGLMCDVDGCIISGTMSNFFLVYQGELMTSDLQKCGVEGITRQWILTEYPDCVVTDITWDKFCQADEIFVCNSIFGVWPIVSCKNNKWEVGPVARALQYKIHTL